MKNKLIILLLLLLIINIYLILLVLLGVKWINNINKDIYLYYFTFKNQFNLWNIFFVINKYWLHLNIYYFN